MTNIFKYLSLQNAYDVRNLFISEEEYTCEEDLKTSSVILKGLGQTLSESLEYDLTMDPNDLKAFLGDCKHIFGLKNYSLGIQAVNHLEIWNVSI